VPGRAAGVHLGRPAGSLAASHHWGAAPTFWLFSFYVIFESFVQILTGYLRNRGILTVRWAVIIGGIVCGAIAYTWLANSTSIWTAYASYAVLGGIGSGMVYSSCINIVAKWYPEKKGWRTGFVNGGWAYGNVVKLSLDRLALLQVRRHVRRSTTSLT
jgi:MFS transporter, OFA family, oxalate/formate antiporter